MSLSSLVYGGAEFSEEAYNKAQHDLENALEQSNFALAKESLNDLMPLMKEDIKYTKKMLKVEKKEGDAAYVAELKEALDRQETILDRLEHMTNVSPAALRASAAKSISLVKEFRKLSLQTAS
ncbi:MAG: hypothetical protein Tsb0034_29260 [Ekhidna sp.]